MKKSRKRISSLAAFMTAAILVFSGCTEGQAEAGQNPDFGDTEPSDTVLEETPAGTAAQAALSDAPADNLNAQFEALGEGSGICFGFTADGVYEPVDTEEYYSYYYALNSADKETYEAVKDYYMYSDMSYEEYREEVLSNSGISPERMEKLSEYELFAVVSYYSEDEEADAASAARKGFEHFAAGISDTDLSREMADGYKTVDVDLFRYGDALLVDARCFNAEGERKTIMDDLICLKGDDFVLIGKTAVSKAAGSLYIYSGTVGFAVENDGYSEEEYEAAVFEYAKSAESIGILMGKEEDMLDIFEFAKEMPDLEKLYIDGYIPVTGTQGLYECGNLKELDISVRSFSDDSALSAAAGLSDLKRLRIRDIASKDSITQINGIDTEELCLECSCDDELLKFVYTLTNVTELEINAGYTSNIPDLNGIEKMTGLKKLGIMTDRGKPQGTVLMTDFAPLSKLQGLTELNIKGNSGKNFEGICGIKTLKTLTIDGLMYNEQGEIGLDLSVLSGCDSIEYLDVRNTHMSFTEAIGGMTNLKKLKIGFNCGKFYEGLENMPESDSLEELIFEDTKLSLTGISKFGNLRSLTLKNMDFLNLYEINGCPNLKTVVIDCDESTSVEAEDIENNAYIEELFFSNVILWHHSSLETLTSLKKLTLDSCSLTEAQINTLSDDMPGCEIVYYQSADPESENSQPVETEYFGDIRVETYSGYDHWHWDKVLLIKNRGSEPLTSVTEFMEENGIANDYSEALIDYPPYDFYTYISEKLFISEGRIDYDSSEVYISILGTPDSDYMKNKSYRTIAPGCEAYVMLHTKDE